LSGRREFNLLQSETFHNLTQAAAQDGTQKATPSTEHQVAPEYASSASDIDDSSCVEIQEVFETISQEKTDKQDSYESDLESEDDNNESTRISSKQKRPPAVFTVRPANPFTERKTNLRKHCKSDKAYSDNCNSVLYIAITKRFPGHGSFDGKITEYHLVSDNYSITYQDGDSQVMSHSNVLKYVKGTKQYDAHHENQVALYSAFHAALSSNTTHSDNVPENYKDARPASDVADWIKGCRNGQT